MVAVAVAVAVAAEAAAAAAATVTARMMVVVTMEDSVPISPCTLAQLLCPSAFNPCDQILLG